MKEWKKEVYQTTPSCYLFPLGFHALTAKLKLWVGILNRLGEYELRFCYVSAEPWNLKIIVKVKVKLLSRVRLFVTRGLEPTNLLRPWDSPGKNTGVGCHLKQRHYFANKGYSSQSYVFSSNHACLWELNNIKGWEPKNWCFPTVVLEKTLESLLDRKEIKAVNPKGNKSWIFIGRTDAKAEAPVLWPPGVRSRLIRKDPDTVKDRRQEEEGTTEDEMIGRHHWLNGHEFE